MSYLVLGDGDFTYSLDLCRYFSMVSNKSEGSSSTSPPLKIVCTGIDTLEELREKYKDIDFILREIRSQSRDDAIHDDKIVKNDIKSVYVSHDSEVRNFKRTRKEVNPHLMIKIGIQTNEAAKVPVIENCSLNISIHHGVNAIHPWDESSHQIYNSDELTCLHPQPPLPQLKFDNVIFNHPHIGTEDAALHSLFLSHFFNTCIQSWLNTGGVLHLTLVKGQCERWKCISSAKKCGLHLIQRVPFASPLESENSRYRVRRHQSGKSFASRAKCGSETLVFGLISNFKEAKECPVDSLSGTSCLPWQHEKSWKKNSKIGLSLQEQSFSCTFCNKSFREERSLKSHIRSVHSKSSEDDVGGKSNVQKQLTCPLCPVLPNIKPRPFVNEAALEAHKVAKHSGIHTKVLPDWCQSTIDKRTRKVHESDARFETETIIDKCVVCSIPFLNEEDRLNHYLDFIPTMACVATKASSNPTQNGFTCMFCDKEFRERRAKMQHENVCPKKPT